MNVTDDILMAYADGELGPAERAQVEAAMRADPRVAEAVERHRALRADVFAVFAGVLDEPVPERLRASAAPAATTPDAGPDAAPVRIDALAVAGARPLPARWSWPQAGALAASLVVGVLAGALGWQGRDDGAATPAASIARVGDAMVAQGALAQALSGQLAGAPATGRDAVRIGVSFAARDGSYCRSFQVGAANGLACHENGRWRVPVLAEGVPEAGGEGGYRQAGSAVPPAVLDAIDQRIAGTALDAAAERAARDRGWERR